MARAGKEKRAAAGGIAPTAAIRPPTSALEGLRLEDRPVDALILYARNARTHSPALVALIAGSIREYGFTSPVLVDGANGIIAGHGRVLASGALDGALWRSVRRSRPMPKPSPVTWLR
jgi:hypothetical protein